MRTALLVSVAAAALLASTVSATTTGLRGLKKAEKELLLATHTDRPSRVILPENYKDKAAWPVIMVLHVRLFFHFDSSFPVRRALRSGTGVASSTCCHPPSLSLLVSFFLSCSFSH